MEELERVKVQSDKEGVEKEWSSSKAAVHVPLIDMNELRLRC